MSRIFNIEYRKVGGLRFIFIGRITFMWCVSKPTHWEASRMESRNYVTIDH